MTIASTLTSSQPLAPLLPVMLVGVAFGVCSRLVVSGDVLPEVAICALNPGVLVGAAASPVTPPPLVFASAVCTPCRAALAEFSAMLVLSMVAWEAAVGSAAA